MSSRLLLGLSLAACLSPVSFVVGSLVGALFLVPDDAGLAGAAIVVGYGVLGALLGAAGAALAAYRLSLPTLRRALAGSATAALLVAVAIGYRYWTLRPPPGQHGGPPASPYQRPYELEIEVTDAGVAAGAPAVSELRLVQTPSGGRVAWASTDLLPARCEAAMVGLEAVDLAAGLQLFAPRASGGIRGCTHARREAPVLFRVRWRVARELTSPTEGEIEIDGHCLQVFDAARDLLGQVVDIHERASAEAACERTADDPDPRVPGPPVTAARVP